MNTEETVFDYKSQKILVDLDYAHFPLLGDQITGYYRLGLVRAQYSNSHITVKINKILSNFYFKEADQTIYNFDQMKYDDFDIIFRHTYNTGAKRLFFTSYSHGLDYPLQKDPNNRDFTKDYEINSTIFKYLPKLKLKNYNEIEERVNTVIFNKRAYQNIVYLAFREGIKKAKERNFNDIILENIILKLANNFKNTLFLMHDYRKKWAYLFSLNNIYNVFPFSQLTPDEINKLNLHKLSFPTLGNTRADLNLEIIYVLINKSDLFITSGNTGIGCYAQYIHPNMLCFVALREIHWITKNNRTYYCLRKEKYSEFSEKEIYEACEKSIKECI